MGRDDYRFREQGQLGNVVNQLPQFATVQKNAYTGVARVGVHVTVRAWLLGFGTGFRLCKAMAVCIFQPGEGLACFRRGVQSRSTSSAVTGIFR